MPNSAAAATVRSIESRILFMRGQKVMLDSDLAELYGVATKVLNQAVKRNLTRFPADFMFRLVAKEARQVELLRSQNVTLKRGQHRKYVPYAFTEQGIAMLSSVLSSERAIDVNIAIIRTFVRLRQLLLANEELANRLEKLEWRQAEQESKVQYVFETIQHLIETPAQEPEKKQFGFPTGHANGI